MARHRKPDPLNEVRIDDTDTDHAYPCAPTPHHWAEFAPSRFVAPESNAHLTWPSPADTPPADDPDSRHDHRDSASPRRGTTPRDLTRTTRGGHRRVAPTPGGRTFVASIAVGAFLSAAAGFPNEQQSPDVALSAAGLGGSATVSTTAPASPPQLLMTPANIEVQARQLTDQLTRGTVRQAERAVRDALALRPAAVKPVSGTTTSNFGARWGTTHYGLDIANVIGTPIVSVTDGEVIEAGPAQGFGLWVRILQDDGTIGVYGHIDEALVSAGQRVRAGDLIATVGNRGQSTGPHLHYEVWEQNGSKADPAGWLSSRGIDIT